METTFTRRRQWITGEKSPLVCEVVEEFPCLQSTKVVSVFFFLCVCVCEECSNAYREALDVLKGGFILLANLSSLL